MNRFIDNDLISNEVNNPILHLEKMLDYFLTKLKNTPNDTSQSREIIKAISIINAFCKEHKLKEIDKSGISLSASTNVLTAKVSTRLSNLILNEQAESYEKLFKKIDNSMSDEDYNHIQDLINKLREKLKESTNFDKDLQRRVLDKLNILQAELDKDINKLELAKGRLMTIADTLGYVHQKGLKPVIDSVIDLANAVRGVEAKSHGVEKFGNILEYTEEIVDVEVVETNTLET